jgi:hypothetical protein
MSEIKHILYESGTFETFKLTDSRVHWQLAALPQF